MTVRAGRTFADGQVSRRLGAVYLMDPRRARPDKRVPHVIPLPEPVHLFGQRGPFVVGGDERCAGDRAGAVAAGEPLTMQPRR